MDYEFIILMDYKEYKTDGDSEKNETITNNQINEEDFYNEIKIIPYFVSEFGLFFIILFFYSFNNDFITIILIFFLIPQYHSGKLFHSKLLNILKKQKYYFRKIFFHLTDIYVSKNLSKKCKDSLIFFNFIY